MFNEMFLKFLICGTIICSAAADNNELSRTYLPPSTQKAKIANDILDLPTNEIVENDLKLQNSEPLTKDIARDPAYGVIPFGYPGVNGGPPIAFTHPGFPGQGYITPSLLRPVFLPQPNLLLQHGFPVPGSLPLPSPQGFVNFGYAQHGFPQQVFPNQVSSFGLSHSNYPAHSSASERLKPAENEVNKLRQQTINGDPQYDAENGGYLYNKPSETF